MRRPEVIQKIHREMRRIGVPTHLYLARPMDAYVEFSVMINPAVRRTLKLRSGIPLAEVEALLADIEIQIILTRRGQQDIETWRRAPTESDSDSNTAFVITSKR